MSFSHILAWSGNNNLYTPFMPISGDELNYVKTVSTYLFRTLRIQTRGGANICVQGYITSKGFGKRETYRGFDGREYQGHSDKQLVYETKESKEELGDILPCSCGKIMFDHNSVETRVNDFKDKGIKMGKYKCPECRYYHLTSQK